MIFEQLEHAGSFTFPRLGGRRNATLLNEAESVAKIVDNFFRERQQVLLRRADPMQGPLAVGLRIGNHVVYRIRYIGDSGGALAASQLGMSVWTRQQVALGSLPAALTPRVGQKT